MSERRELRIWKYELPLAGDGFVELSMPIGAEVLAVQVQRGTPCLWALVDPSADRETRRYRWVGTGEPIDDSYSMHRVGPWYRGTVQLVHDSLVFHLFDVPQGQP